MERKDITNKLKARFCKDCNLAINIYEEPYFTDRLKLYDKQFGTLEKWEVFCKELEKYENEQEYLSEYNKVKDLAINAVKSTRAWEHFNLEDMNKFGTQDLKFPTNNIYKDTNIGKKFLSIDMKHANFSALKHYSDEIFKCGDKECKDWKEFISQFTDSEHIVNSKYIRQVVLGNCNPKRTITYEKHIIASLIRAMLGMDVAKNIVSFASDEVIMDIADMSDVQLNNEIEVVKELIDTLGVPLKVEVFTLHRIEGTDGFIKKYSMGKEGIDIKCLNSLYMPFVLRELNGEAITESDRTFIYEGMLSRVVENPEIKIAM